MSDYLNLHVTGTQDTRYQVKINLKLHVTETRSFGYQVKYNLRLSVLNKPFIFIFTWYLVSCVPVTCRFR
jgi:hypothetical protein